MKYFTLIPVVLTGFLSPASSIVDPSKYPVPSTTPKTLFYIQRSNNANTVLYEANLLNDSTLNPKDPVRVYWIRYAEKGQTRDLNLLEKTVAYGVKCQPAGKDQYLMNFVASKAKHVDVLLDRNGAAHALMDIGARKSRLTKIFVHVAEDGWWPKIDYVEFFGFDAATQEPTYEKLKV